MPGNELVQSLTRGLEILQLSGKNENGIRVTDAADSLGIKFPTAHNLLRTLVAKGFLRKTESNTYVIGKAFLELAEFSSAKLRSSIIGNLMLKISLEVPDANVVYAEEVNDNIVMKFRIQPKMPGIIQKTDSAMRLYSTSSGLTFLAFAHDEIKDMLMQESPFPEEGIILWKSFSKFEKFLADSVKKSYVSPDFEGAARKSVSVPVYTESGALIGALGLTVDIDENIDARIRKLAEYLHESLKTITLK